MSASREKKKRQELYEAGELTRDAKKTPKGGLSKKVGWLISAGVVVVIAVFIWLMITNSSAFLNNVTAVSVGDTKLSAADTEYYYWDAATTVANYFGDSFQYFVDTSKSYKSQQYSEDMSWADYFMSLAENNMQQLEILSSQARANGETLTAEQQEQIDSSYANLEASAKNAGYRNAEAYLKALYGKASSEKSFREYLTRQTLASAYYTKVMDSYSFTSEERSSYYNEHKNDYDTVSFRVLSTTDKEEADRIASVSANHEATFLDEAAALHQPAEDEEEDDYDADAATLYEETAMSNVSSYYSEWLFDEARLPGETYVASNESADSTAAPTYYVVYFLERQTKDQRLVNVRHILISVSDASDEDAMNDARVKAETLLAQWQSGEATEDSFAELASENSSDPGSQENGGLYEDVYPGQMVAAFNDWCFDESRQVGDTGIVATDYGYHVMYFSGYSDNFDTYRDYLVDSTLRTNAYNEWYAGMQEQYPVDAKSFGMMFVRQ